MRLFLQNGVSRVPAADGHIPHVAGMTLVFDESDAGVEGELSVIVPSRVESLTVTKADGTVFDLVQNFQFISTEETFVLAMNSFLASGGDGYSAIAAAFKLGNDTNVGEQQILEDYIGMEVSGTVDIAKTPMNPRVSRVTDMVTTAP